ncbi:endolytic transglycosylase MltG [Carboxylicivirga mesophila]|uniref:Endolytic murein transglycosylase n=1 Tax=Carboxylicivirga mesophila TaxID=1166478 RepID=A0ABS5K766_9BACT|nr:endolytic transglycosylase MltG [Carboxylicivirga mesophila]MBS2210805.1 endolytic transglycosylase MltG [Carboxylicivirga mesophila]
MAIKQQSKKARPNKSLLRLFYMLLIVIIAAVLIGRSFYNKIFEPNVTIKGGQEFFYIPTGADFEDVIVALEDGAYIKDVDAFKWVAQKKNYTTIKPGRYKLVNNWSNNDLVNTLRSGNQSAVKVTFNNIRTMPELAGKISQYLEADSTAFLEALTNEELIKDLGFNKATSPALFIPNTYEFWWNTSPEKFIDRMHNEYEKFWTASRRSKAKAAGLTPLEVSTLAAIVDEETIKQDEKPKVAGLYINRLKKNIRLQADPTIKYAIGDFTIQRVLTKDLATDSPYNTYLYAGLPPGPIRIPSVSGIEAVLNYTQHQYLYMCAKEDFSGYHNFAKTLKQHNINAAKFQRALNQQRIYR